MQIAEQKGVTIWVYPILKNSFFTKPKKFTVLPCYISSHTMKEIEKKKKLYKLTDQMTYPPINPRVARRHQKQDTEKHNTIRFWFNKDFLKWNK